MDPGHACSTPLDSVEPLFLGLDVGTSGIRAIAIDEQERIVGQTAKALPEPIRQGAHVEQDPHIWWHTARHVIRELADSLPGDYYIARIAVDGTSSTLLLADIHGVPLGPALMYNDASATVQGQAIAAIAPRTCAAHGASSGLAKLLQLQKKTGSEAASFVLHQADWIAGQLMGRYGFSDENNCLKLGFDPIYKQWPAWMERLGTRMELLPTVMPPGTDLGVIRPQVALDLHLTTQTRIVLGTTDSTAGFLATGAVKPGEAVTSLGSTLVLKIISEKPIFAPEYGVYSQPLGALWLTGGGSNCGGTTLRQYFSPEQIAQLTKRLDPDNPTDLDYYPLPGPGERFPVADPTLSPRLTPRPADDAKFFQGILEALARIEQRGYMLLAQLEAPAPSSVRSIGGGAANEPWSRIRARLLGIPLVPAAHLEAAFGAALLAKRGLPPINPDFPLGS